MNFAQRFEEIRSGFEAPFWVANFTEIFERVAYYGTTAVLAIYLSEQLHFSSELTGWLMGIFGLAVYFLPILGGTLADRFGFRRSLIFAYLVLTLGYFLLGSLSAPWMETTRRALGDKWLVLAVLMIPSLGPGLVKPCVAGTTARASAENVRSLGYSIYYTLVNIGGATGPLLASVVHKHLRVENVFRLAALNVFVMFFAVLLFFREPRRSGEVQTPSLWHTLRHFSQVLTNPKFMLFLLIFSGYWIVFWQQFITLPLYIHAYINPNANTEWVLAVDPLTVISLQIVVAYLTKKIPSFRAITLGTLISALAWLIVAGRPTVGGAVSALIVVALGEMLQSPRYYEYISRLAPPGQQGTYMGFAFLPIGIGSLLAGRIGGRLLHHYGEVLHQPQRFWWAITGIGALTALLLWIYDRAVKPGAPREP